MKRGVDTFKHLLDLLTGKGTWLEYVLWALGQERRDGIKRILGSRTP
jgi:hypothetical protein